MTLLEIERELRAAMDAWVAGGGKIARGSHPDHLKCLCALEAYSAMTSAPWPLSGDMAWAFMYSFDGAISQQTKAYPAIAALGRKLAREYVDGVRS